MTKIDSSPLVTSPKENFLLDLPFPLLMGGVSRGVILLAMLGVAPLLSAPSGGVHAEFGWSVFSAWDSPAYQQIATTGYEILPNQQPGANVAFFPLYSLLIGTIMKLGLSAEVAGTIGSNLAFFGTLILLYRWVKQNHGEKAAKWSTAVLAWCPLSLFGSVIYSEGLFLFLSTLALYSFDQRHYAQSAVWGGLATATRITGIALIPAFLITAWLRKYPIKAYLAALVSSYGVLLYSVYCWFQFRDPIAFLTVQHTHWQRTQGIDGLGWWRMIVEITAGSANWHHGGIKDPLHPLIFALILIIAGFLWYFKHKITSYVLDYSFFALFVVLWLLAGDPLLNTMSILGGVYLLWRLRQELSIMVVSYGFFALGLIIVSGGTSSLNRYAYGIISLSFALGVLLSRHPRWGFAVMGFFGVLLISFSIRFAQHLWVA